MIRFLYLLLAALLPLVLLTGCSGRPHAPELPAGPEPAPVPALEKEPEALPQTDSLLPDYTQAVREHMALNTDTVGWLSIPDTGIDQVILMTNNNDYYLSHDFDHNEDSGGSFFADFRSQFGSGLRRELALLTTLYGHSFREDPASGLFSGLKYFRDEQFAREHPYIFFSTQAENMAFEIFAVFEAHIDLPYNHFQLSSERYRKMLEDVAASSLYDYGIHPREGDRLLVLSTCAMTVQGHESLDPYTTDYRFVLMGRLVDPNQADKETASLTANPSPASPDEFLGWSYHN